MVSSSPEVHHLHVWLENLKIQTATHPALADRCELMMERLIMKLQEHEEMNFVLRGLHRSLDHIETPSQFIGFAQATLNILDAIDRID